MGTGCGCAGQGAPRGDCAPGLEAGKHHADGDEREAVGFRPGKASSAADECGDIDGCSNAGFSDDGTGNDCRNQNRWKAKNWMDGDIFSLGAVLYEMLTAGRLLTGRPSSASRVRFSKRSQNHFA